MTKKEIVIVVNLKTLGKYSLISVIGLISICAIFSNKLNPGSGVFYNMLYNIKRAEENLVLKFLPTPNLKLNIYEYLLDRRLSELQYLAKNGNFSMFWSASLRYSTTAGRITQILKSNNYPSEKAYYLKKFEDHQDKIQTILDSYIENYIEKHPNDQWKFIQDADNYLELYQKDLSG